MTSGSATLRRNFAWTFAGNATYAVGQWAILSLFAKLGSSEMLGQYALCLAVTAPVAMLSHLNLRAVIATDVAGQHSFSQYLGVRMAATAAGLVAIAVLALFAAPGLGFVVLAAGIAQSAENVSDAFYGEMQRRERMRRIAVSMMLRAAVSVLALGVTLSVTHDIASAVVALALARMVTLVVFDAAGTGSRFSFSRAPRIFRTALPLGIVLMLVTLNANVPRYAIERNLGVRELGIFAAVASFMTGGNTVINALGQTATPRLARYFAERQRRAFARLVLRLCGLAVLLGAGGVAVAGLVGGPILRLVYRAEYAEYAGLLVGVMAAAIPIYVASTLGYAITSVRAFDAQLPLFCVVAASCAAAAWVLVPRFGLMGAPMALAIAGCVQVMGEVFILRRAVAAR